MNPKDILPKTTKTVEAICNAWKAKGVSEPERGYLGASIIGHSCERYLWYQFRNACKEDFSGRMYRLFDRGNVEEPRMVDDLRMIGCTVHEVDPKTGQQFEVSAFGGHFSGHMDGCALGIPEAPKTWHVFEGKTHNNKSFAELEKKGVLKSKPQHYAQVQVYMGLTGMKRAIYLAVNKDTEELYAERVKYDKEYFEQLMERAHRIITSNNLPPRISDRPDWYECSWCPAKELCHATTQESEACKTPGVSCRQCCFATPDTAGEDARWTCDKFGKGLSKEDQGRACNQLLLLPGIVEGHSDPVNYGADDGGADYIDYQTREGGYKWRQGGREGWSATELRCVSVSTLSNPLIAKARDCGATIPHHESTGNAIERYSDMETCWCSWSGHASEVQVGWQQLYGTKLADLPPLDNDENLQLIAVEYQASAGAKACICVDTSSMKAYIMEEKC